MSSPSAAAREPSEVTRLLVAWQAGDRSALERIVPLVEVELRRQAHRYFRSERQGHVLQTTAPVNEAFVRLLNWRDVSREWAKARAWLYREVGGTRAPQTPPA